MTTLVGKQGRTLPWATGKYLAQVDAITHARTTREAMVQAGLDWTVELEPTFHLTDVEGFRTYEEVPDSFVTKRSTDGKVLGVVGKQYTPYQNDRLASFTDALVDTTASSKAGMGELFGGKRVFTVVQLDGDLTPPGMPSEAQTPFIICANSHDGSAVISSSIVVYRWACTNGLIGIVPGMAHTVAVKHTLKADARMTQALSVMRQANSYLDAHRALTEELLSIPMAGGDAIDLLEQLIPDPKVLSADDVRTPKRLRSHRNAMRRAHRERTEIHALITRSPNLEHIRQTSWGFINAVAEWDQWRTNSRRKHTPMERLVANGDSQRLVHRARDLVLA